MSLSSVNFNGSVYVSEQLNRQLVNLCQDFAERCVSECASMYNFDGEEACRLLGLSMIKMERKQPMKENVVKEKAEKVTKAAFPLPYNGELNDSCCYALRQNNGLYTQCTGDRRNGSDFCKSCCTTMQKSGSEIPEYGTIQGRKAVGIFEYVDPKGRKPTTFTKVMKKYKITKEQVLEEAGKLNIVVNPEHFVAPEETKRGRPSSNKEPKEKGVKGRPKKSKKVLEIEGDDDDDLFATLVANANEDAEEDILSSKSVKKVASTEEKAEKEAKLAAEKVEKEAKRLAEKVEKEAKLAAEKAEKEAKKEQERLAREEKKKAEEEAKRIKEEKRLQEKAEKEAKLAAEKEAKETSKKPSKKASSPKAEEEEDDEEPMTVKRIEFEGKKYLKSKKSGVIYDYIKYTKEGDLVDIGIWNINTNKIDFKAVDDNSDEESEDEYDN
jgi:hypothetical protein